ncbi:MAG: glycoside hydrolase family 16 protein [Pseudomonadota bacterium]
MRISKLFMAMIVGLALSACSMTQKVVLVPESCELVPVMLEEFDSLRVSPNRIGLARWTAHTPWWGDFGDAQFTDPGRDGPFSVDQGILSIKAWRDKTGKWRSGLLAAADRSGRGSGTQYGYFETRMKFPKGPGTWPAFWLMPLRAVGSVDPRLEIDVLEYYGHRTDQFHSVLHLHYEAPGKRWNTGIQTAVAPDSLVSEFNTYGVDISPEWIVFFLNGEEFWRYPTPEELDYPMYPIVNLALGSGWPIDETPDPSILLVDYVHVYGRSPRSDCSPGLDGFKVKSSAAVDRHAD